MTATYQTVTIGGREYVTYADLATADEYLDADPFAEGWRAATDDDVKGRAEVAATRVLEVQNWLGEKTDPDQELQWPRTGVVVGGVAIDPSVIPLAIVNASIELASAVTNGVDIVNYVDSTTIQRRVKAGSVEVENFRQLGTAARSLPLPKAAWVLIRAFTGAGTRFGGATSTGTDGCSSLEHPFEHSRGI